jgi:hypothetical protein
MFWRSFMPAISKTYMVCLLTTIILCACGSGGQTSSVTAQPSSTGLQATAVEYLLCIAKPEASPRTATSHPAT